MRKVLLNAVTYAQLYLEMRISECKRKGECTKEYEQELAEIQEYWKVESKKK